MYLTVGNNQRIDEPTAEQIAWHLNHLPSDAPFLILNADAEHFLQATPVGDAVRVEWRQESHQRYMLVTRDQAEQLFDAFRRWDEPSLSAFPWKRLGMLNDPYRRLPFVLFVLAAIALVRLWFALK
jgi:hypothetical protein